MLRAAALTILSFWAVASVANDTDTDCSKPFLITVAADGGCNFSKVVVACESAGSLLLSMGLRADCEVRVAGDPYTPYQHIGALLRSLQDAGFIKVAFASGQAGAK
jgi:biopolymer transport protein ExbD